MKKYIYRYRHEHAPWGIYIEINATCERYSKNNFAGVYHGITEGIHLVISNNSYPESNEISKNALKYILNGLKAISDSIIKLSPYTDDTLIVIDSVLYSYCDYQDIGFMPAIIGWAAEEFNFIPPKVEMVFNQEKNIYELNSPIII